MVQIFDFYFYYFNGFFIPIFILSGLTSLGTLIVSCDILRNLNGLEFRKELTWR